MTRFFSAGQSESRELDEAEAQMRQALGTRTSQPSQNKPASRTPRRFVRDGEVETVIINARGAPPGQSKAAEEALKAERLARGQIEHELRDARVLIRSLQTQLAHSEMARMEALQQLEKRAVVEVAPEPIAPTAAEIWPTARTQERVAPVASLMLASKPRATEFPASEPPASEPSEPEPQAPEYSPPGSLAHDPLAHDPLAPVSPATEISLPERRTRRVGRPPKPVVKPEPAEEKPVEWWVPGWRERL